jgi:hypothetical protein
MRERENSQATISEWCVKRGNFVAEIKVQGDLYRFLIRDQDRLKPTIHGTKKSRQETESEIDTVLNRLCPEEQVA